MFGKHSTYLHTAVLDVIVPVLGDPLGHQALAMVLPDSFGRHCYRVMGRKWLGVVVGVGGEAATRFVR